MKKLKLTEAAEADLDEIAVHIATKRDVMTALGVVEDLRERMKLLRTSPLMGRESKTDDTRELILDNYVIPYRVRENVVEILRVWHGKERWWG
ncbi:MAG: type II toxin-antitoxin system RelE/ParE family toxin [Deltaproteobacteria bacterium]|nr:type II toxin-antitoxin system RelE/ParE family toxin [Deltaproteobacteria bacterium]